MRAADVHLPTVHAKHPQPEVRIAAQFLGGEGPGTTLWTERFGQVLGEGSGLDFARGAGLSPQGASLPGPLVSTGARRAGWDISGRR